ncbi:MAG: hypothetical protein AB3N33_06905 [Puniceicoccaceae bacterium]
MISHVYSSIAKNWIFLLLTLPACLFAGDPIPHIDITVDQTPGPKKNGVTDANGELVLSGFNPGPVVVSVKYGDQLAVIGKTGKDRIILPADAKVGIKPIRLELSNYSVSTDGKAGGELSANHNTTRSNRLAPAQADVDNPSGKGDQRSLSHNTTRSNRSSAESVTDIGAQSGGTKARDYNSSRSNISTAVEVEKDLDQDPVVEITPMPGGRVKISVMAD